MTPARRAALTLVFALSLTACKNDGTSTGPSEPNPLLDSLGKSVQSLTDASAQAVKDTGDQAAKIPQTEIDKAKAKADAEQKKYEDKAKGAVPSAKAGEIKKGQSNKDAVRKAMGEPKEVRSTEAGEQWVYKYAPKLSKDVPIVLGFGTVTVTFDDQDVVKDMVTGYEPAQPAAAPAQTQPK